jgi:uncharacterized protein YbbC (DUF1343 family)
MTRSVWILISLLFLNIQISCAQEITILKDKDVVNGAERTDVYLSQLRSKAVGLIVNHSSRVGDKHLLDVLLEMDINVTAVFSPEHGFEGSLPAGEEVEHMVYRDTGIPIYSLYGTTKSPDITILEKQQ